LQYNFDFDIASLILYLIVCVYFFQKKRVYNTRNKFFLMLLSASIILPVTDIIRVLLLANRAGWVAVTLAAMFVFVCRQLTVIALLLYVQAQLSYFTKEKVIGRAIVFAPAIAVLLVILSNPVNGLVYTYENYQFTYGSFRPYIYSINILYYIGYIVYVNYKRKYLNKQLYGIIHIVVLLNIIAAIVQFFVPSLRSEAMAQSVGLVIIVLNMDKYDISLNSVTGLAKRRYIQSSCERLMYSRRAFDLVMISLIDTAVLEKSYGSENISVLTDEIGKKIYTFAKPGYSFRINTSSYALIIPGNTDIGGKKRQILSELSHAWHIKEMEVDCEFAVTSVNYPMDVDHSDDCAAYIDCFASANLRTNGIFGPEELHVNDIHREQEVGRIVEKAIAERSFEIYYQPICTANDQRFMSAEALIRLIDSEEGFISPGEFIPIAEKNGSIIDIGYFVVDSVCRFIAEHDMEELGLSYIELNLSMVQCMQSNFIYTIDEITQRYNIDNKYLCFEITETASSYSTAVFSENLKMLSERGFSLALDDFGTGYSSFQRMATSRFHVIKFDKDLTQSLSTDKHLDGVLSTLETMIHSMGSKIVTEGVETQEQYEYVNAAGCDYIQGFYFSKPLPEQEFIQFLLDRKIKNAI